MAEEITLRVALPEVVETPIRILVSCGLTTAYVYEHGAQGGGSWAVWTYSGGSIIAGGTNGYSRERALTDACAHVRRQERQRLLFEQLRRALEEQELLDHQEET
jgi:hypothetical protein